MPNRDRLHEGLKIFTHKLWKAYDYTPIPDFDIPEQEIPFIDDEASKSFNADKFAKNLTEKLEQNRTSAYRHDHIFMQWGGDFAYSNAFFDYKQLDGLIRYMNLHYADKYHFRYSTPSEYIDAIANLNIT